MYRVAIIGAGIRGLSSAVVLKNRGCQVSLFEKSDNVGGIWARVFPSSVINTPAHGYTFHPDNEWPSHRANTEQILQNVNRMVECEGLLPHIRFNTPVDSVTKTSRKAWQINGETTEYDGLLVATGYMGRPKEAPDEIRTAFKGRTLRPYDFVPAYLKGNRIVIVGSGETALEMLMTAVRQRCGHAHLVIRPGVEPRGVKPYSHLAFCISGSPFLYPLTKSRGKFHRVVCDGIEEVLALPNVEVWRSEINEIHDDSFVLKDGNEFAADVLIWCTGWDPLLPTWASRFKADPTMVVASCKRCLDTGGFGNGTSSAHAKGLYAALVYELKTPFTSESNGCQCDQEQFQHTRHVLMNLLIYFLKQPRGWKIVVENLFHGWKSNRERFRRSREPWWAKIAAFVNAPFGL